MAITYPRPLPATPGIQSARFVLGFNNEDFISPINNVKQTIRRPGDLWGGFYAFAPKKATVADIRIFKAFLITLQGTNKTFLGFDPLNRDPRGIANTGSDTILVNGSSQQGNSLVCDGARNNGTNLLMVGDYFQVGNTGAAIQLKMMTEDASSDGSGNITLNFEPPLSAAPAENAPIIFNDPVGVFRLTTNDLAGWDATPSEFTLFTFSFIEEAQKA